MTPRQYAFYKRYIQSDKWRQKRRDIAKIKKPVCYICAKKGVLDLHHRTYKNLGREKPRDLVWMCKRCHKLLHTILRNRGKTRKHNLSNCHVYMKKAIKAKGWSFIRRYANRQ